MNRSPVIIQDSPFPIEPSQFPQSEPFFRDKSDVYPQVSTWTAQLYQIAPSFIQALQFYLDSGNFADFLGCFSEDTILHRYYPLAAQMVAAYQKLPKHSPGDQQATLSEQEWMQLYQVIFSSTEVQLQILNLAAVWENYGRTVACRKAIARLQSHQTELRLLLLYGDEPIVAQGITDPRHKQALAEFRELFYRYLPYQKEGNASEEHFIHWLAFSSNGDQRPHYIKLADTLTEFLIAINYDEDALTSLESNLKQLRGSNSRFLQACYQINSEQSQWLAQHREHASFKEFFYQLSGCMLSVVGESNWQYFTKTGTWSISNDQILHHAMLSGQVNQCNKLLPRISKLSEQYRQERIIKNLKDHPTSIGELIDVLLTHADDGAQQKALRACFPQFFHPDVKIQIFGVLHKVIGPLQIFLQSIQLPANINISDAWCSFLDAGDIAPLERLFKQKQKIRLSVQGQATGDSAHGKTTILSKVLASFLLPLGKCLQLAQNIKVKDVDTLLTTTDLDRHCFSARKPGERIQPPPVSLSTSTGLEDGIVAVDAKTTKPPQPTPPSTPNNKPRKGERAKTTGAIKQHNSIKKENLKSNARRRLFSDSVVQIVQMAKLPDEGEIKKEASLSAPIDSSQPGELLVLTSTVLTPVSVVSLAPPTTAASITPPQPALLRVPPPSAASPPQSPPPSAANSRVIRGDRLAEAASNSVPSLLQTRAPVRKQSNPVILQGTGADCCFARHQLGRKSKAAGKTIKTEISAEKHQKSSQVITSKASPSLFNYQTGSHGSTALVTHLEKPGFASRLLDGVLFVINGFFNSLAWLGLFSLALAFPTPAAISPYTVGAEGRRPSTPNLRVPTPKPTAGLPPPSKSDTAPTMVSSFR